jgi:hypothetical protein
MRTLGRKHRPASPARVALAGEVAVAAPSLRRPEGT